MSKYLIRLKDLTDLAGNEILSELAQHNSKARASDFPDEFVVLIEIGVQWNEDYMEFYLADDNPFLDMGSMDAGFYATAALLKILGKELHFSNQNEQAPKS